MVGDVTNRRGLEIKFRKNRPGTDLFAALRYCIRPFNIVQYLYSAQALRTPPSCTADSVHRLWPWYNYARVQPCRAVRFEVQEVELDGIFGKTGLRIDNVEDTKNGGSKRAIVGVCRIHSEMSRKPSALPRIAVSTHTGTTIQIRAFTEVSVAL